MTGASIRLEGTDAVRKALASVADGLSQARPLWQQIGAEVLKSTQRRFGTGTAPDGNPWPPSLRALAEDGQTLVNSGRLLDSLNYQATDSQVEVGTNVIYAAIHQFGGDVHHKARKQVLNFKAHARTGKILRGFRSKSKSNLSMQADVGAHDIRIPARPFLGLDDQDEVAVIKVVEDYVARLAQ